MSTSETGGFDASGLSLGSIPAGTSILLTGDGTAAIERVFYRLVAARDGERSLILATETNGRTVNRELDRIEYGISNRSTVLTCRGAADADNVTTVDDIGDLTGVGIQFSALVAESGTLATAQRAGILLSPSICRAVDEIQSVFRFLNANFLSHLRREGIMGVCAVDTAATGGEIDGVIESMSAAFSAHIDVETAADGALVLHLSGIDGYSEAIRVDPAS